MSELEALFELSKNIISESDGLTKLRDEERERVINFLAFAIQCVNSQPKLVSHWLDFSKKLYLFLLKPDQTAIPVNFSKALLTQFKLTIQKAQLEIGVDLLEEFKKTWYEKSWIVPVKLLPFFSSKRCTESKNVIVLFDREDKTEICESAAL